MNTSVAIYFEEDGFLESPSRSHAPADSPLGPLGRRVAGKEFLTAYFRHAKTPAFAAVISNSQAGKSVTQLYFESTRNEANRRDLRTLHLRRFHKVFFPKSPADVIHYPSPLNSCFAWARQYGGESSAYALSGITHTICTPRVMVALSEMITAPFESFDAMICISRAAMTVLRTVADTYCEYLRDRMGGNPTFRPRLEHIPLGVDITKFRPPSSAERRAERAKLGIADDELVVLYLGRLSYHGKTHPFPLYQAVVRAAKAARKKVRLIMAGWAADPSILDAFKSGAATFAPEIVVQFVDGTSDEVRYKIWWAADIFAFPTDNYQETLPQSVIEAMACGLPVVASDWNGCRDEVVHGQTGFLIPTRVVSGATDDATSKALLNEYVGSELLARCNQTVAVDVRAMIAALRDLLLDPTLRSRMGAAGHERAVNVFSWERIIPLYEQLWEQQNQQRLDFVKHNASKSPRFAVPAIYPPPEFSFRSYPSGTFDADMCVQALPDASKRLEILNRHTLTSYGQQWRCTDEKLLTEIIAAAGSIATLAQLEEILAQAGVDSITRRSTLAWMLKYGIVEPIETPPGEFKTWERRGK
jgi:glycosyltransferase involved in cell wall biosynthesis